MKVEIIAEIANAHQGNPDIAIEIANKAINCGADAVKFQMYTADDLLAVSHSRYQHFKNQSFSKKTDMYFRLKRLIDEKHMGNLFKFMLIKNQSNKFKLGFEN